MPIFPSIRKAIVTKCRKCGVTCYRQVDIGKRVNLRKVKCSNCEPGGWYAITDSPPTQKKAGKKAGVPC